MIPNSNVFEIKGTIVGGLTEQFKNFLRALPTNTHTMYIRINSCGGNRWEAFKIIRFLYYIEVIKKINVITQCYVCYSCALNIFSSGTVREIIKSSEGMIHLPTSKNKKLQKTLYILDQKTFDLYEYLSDGKLTKEKIIQINGKCLSALDMINYCLADKIVKNFKPVYLE